MDAIVQGSCRIAEQGSSGRENLPPRCTVDLPITPLPGVRGLLFEPAGVLYDETVWRNWLIQLLRRLGLYTHYRVFFEVWDREYLVSVHAGETDYRTALTGFFAAIGLAPAHIDELVSSALAQRRACQEERRPLHGACETLKRLQAAGVVLAVSADCEYEEPVLAGKLANLGLGDVLSAIVSSRSQGAVKPDPVCYDAAAKAMFLAPAEIAFVGCREDHLQGAQRAGMRTIALNVPIEIEADCVLASIEQLAQVVGSAPLQRRAG